MGTLRTGSILLLRNAEELEVVLIGKASDPCDLGSFLIGKLIEHGKEILTGSLILFDYPACRRNDTSCTVLFNGLLDTLLFESKILELNILICRNDIDMDRALIAVLQVGDIESVIAVGRICVCIVSDFRDLLHLSAVDLINTACGIKGEIYHRLDRRTAQKHIQYEISNYAQNIHQQIDSAEDNLDVFLGAGGKEYDDSNHEGRHDQCPVVHIQKYQAEGHRHHKHAYQPCEEDLPREDHQSKEDNARRSVKHKERACHSLSKFKFIKKCSIGKQDYHRKISGGKDRHTPLYPYITKNILQTKSSLKRIRTYSTHNTILYYFSLKIKPFEKLFSFCHILDSGISCEQSVEYELLTSGEASGDLGIIAVNDAGLHILLYLYAVYQEIHEFSVAHGLYGFGGDNYSILP